MQIQVHFYVFDFLTKRGSKYNKKKKRYICIFTKLFFFLKYSFRSTNSEDLVGYFYAFFRVTCRTAFTPSFFPPFLSKFRRKQSVKKKKRKEKENQINRLVFGCTIDWSPYQSIRQEMRLRLPPILPPDGLPRRPPLADTSPLRYV